MFGHTQTISAWLGVNEIAPTPEFLKLAGSQTCRDKAVTQIICENILFLTMGYSSDQLNTVGIFSIYCFSYYKYYQIYIGIFFYIYRLSCL